MHIGELARRHKRTDQRKQKRRVVNRRANKKAAIKTAKTRVRMTELDKSPMPFGVGGAARSRPDTDKTTRMNHQSITAPGENSLPRRSRPVPS